MGREDAPLRPALKPAPMATLLRKPGGRALLAALMLAGAAIWAGLAYGCYEAYVALR